MPQPPGCLSRKLVLLVAKAMSSRHGGREADGKHTAPCSSSCKGHCSTQSNHRNCCSNYLDSCECSSVTDSEGRQQHAGSHKGREATNVNWQNPWAHCQMRHFCDASDSCLQEARAVVAGQSGAPRSPWGHLAGGTCRGAQGPRPPGPACAPVTCPAGCCSAPSPWQHSPPACRLVAAAM